MKPALIIMVKNPVKGKVKTRIAKDVGEEEALKIYLKLLEHTKTITQNIKADKYIFYSDYLDRNDFFNNSIYKKYTQCSGNLGVRMDYAFSIPFKNEYNHVVMIGADCYALQQKHIDEAFEKLESNDFVFGPAKDGGYYLIAMKKWNKWVFQNKPWSTEKLYSETKQEIISNNGTMHELEILTDIDTVDDWNREGEL